MPCITVLWGWFILYCRQCEGYAVSTLQVSHGRSTEKRTIKQYRFTDWPEHGLPPSTTSMVEVVRCVDEDASAHAPAPLLIHCANGMGKSGAVMAVHFSLKQFSTDGTVDLLKVVNTLRRQRGALLQSKDQYHFCCRAIADALDPLGPREEESSADAAESLTVSKKEEGRTAAVPFEVKSTVRPFSAPVDASSLTPRTQRKLYLQNMLPPPPPYPPSQTNLLPTNTPPPPFASPKDKSTPLKSPGVSPSSVSSFDSIVKTRAISETSMKNVGSASSLGSVPKKGRTEVGGMDQPERVLGGKLAVEPRVTANDDGSPQEEVTTTILQVDYLDSTLEDPPSGEESTTSHKPDPAQVQPRKGWSPPMQRKSSTVRSRQEETSTQPLRGTLPERRALGSKRPSVTKMGDSHTQAQPLTLRDNVEEEQVEEVGKQPSPKHGDQPSGQHSVEHQKQIEKKEEEEEEEEKEVVGFVISDEPLLAPSKPVVSSASSKPAAKRTWKPPAKSTFQVTEKKPKPTPTFPKADVPREEKDGQPPHQRAPSPDTQHEEFDIRSRPIGKLNLSKFQMFESPKLLRAHKGGPSHMTTPPKKPEPEQPPPPTFPSPSPPEPEPATIKQALPQPTATPSERSPQAKVNLSQWESPAAAPAPIPAWKQQLLQRKTEQKAKEEAHTSPPAKMEAPTSEEAEGPRSVKKLDMSRFAVFGSPK